MTPTAPLQPDPDAPAAALRADGIARVPGGLGADLTEALAGELGSAWAGPETEAAPRGRWRVDLHPEETPTAFPRIVLHPGLRAVADAVLGPDWWLAGWVLAVTAPGARYQPWHRDRRHPPGVLELAPRECERALLRTVTLDVATAAVTAADGPLQYVPGSHVHSGEAFRDGRFPEHPSLRDYYERHHTALLGSAGGLTTRSPHLIHRGAPHRGAAPRRTLHLEIAAADAPWSDRRSLCLTRRYRDALPAELLPRLRHATVLDVGALPPRERPPNDRSRT
jgi:hypothetical protein